MNRADEIMPHRHRRLAFPAVVLLLAACAALALWMTSCRAFTPTPPAPTSEPEPSVEAVVSELPAFVLDASLPSQIVHNANQGLGQCHWVDPQIVSKDEVSWGYDSGQTSVGWDYIEPQPGVFNWAPLDAEIAKARDLGKHIWIELHTTEGYTPQWARDAGVPLIGSRGGTPAPWNATYQRLLRRAVHAMAARYDNDPTVDAINIMAGGCYGEMTICAAQMDEKAWLQAGYTDEFFVEAVKQIVEIYLEQEYTWEDGTKTHGFLQTPVVLQVGGGLYNHTRVVIDPVVQYLMPKYGMRIWLKYNGWGGGYDTGWLFQDYDALSRVGYEPMGNSPEFNSTPKAHVRLALDQHCSYVCLQSPYYAYTDTVWIEAREMAARYLGAQIILQGTNAPAEVVPGQSYSFTTRWVNRGTTPLMRPRREGIKDVPASYDLVIAFVDPGTGAAVFSQTFTPQTPTTNWFSARPVTITKSIAIPTYIPSGTYDLRVALVNPNLAVDDGQRYFHLVNVDLHDGIGRYEVGQIRVNNVAIPEVPTPTAVPPSATASAKLPPVIFVMLDWMNGDWGNPNYRFSYVDKYGYRQEYRGRPEYGALGGWTVFSWNDLNPGKGSYDWSKVDKYIKDAQAMRVTLPDGTVMPKPVGISVQTWSMEELDDRIGINYTPGWVAAEIGSTLSSCYDPDGGGPCKPFCTPRWSSLGWQYWFDQFILALGQRYDNNAEFYNLSFINIATGADDETSERKSLGGCAYDPGGNTRAFDDWVLHVMGTYNLAFANTPQFIQSTLHGIHVHAQLAANFPSKMTGVKVNGLEVDVPSAEVRLDGVLLGGVTGFSEVWNELIPTGYEPKHGNGIEGSYWFYMQGLSTRPYMFDMQLPNIQDCYLAEQRIGFPIHNFVRTHLGKTPQNAPDVWIVLRDTYFQNTTWTGSDGVVRTYGPHFGDFAYYLYRRDTAPGSRTVALRAEALNAELPAAARSHIYGWHSSRRTDQGTGNPYMSFDVEDRYPHVSQKPQAAGGQVTWHITATLLNKGTDSFSLEYMDYYGNLQERRVSKGASLGTTNQWVDYTWNLTDAYFNNGMPGGNDFRISCNNDGNEIIHRLIVRAVGPPPPTPTVTRTLPPTRTPTKTTTPATPTPTVTRTPTRTLGPSPTNTRLPTSTPTSGPSPTPTPLPTQFPGGQNVVTLQQELYDYWGATDTYILTWNPQSNYGNQANLQVKNDSVYSSLLHFDLISLPAGSTINKATLALYAYQRDKDQALTLEVYRVMRPWVDLEATWERASVGNAWGTPGANMVGTDRTGTPIRSQQVSLINSWHELDITAMVRFWALNPETNFGMILRGSGDISVVYHFASANHPTRALRPMLVIDYTAPVVALTATPTPPPTLTPTPSGTQLPTAVPTATPYVSPTRTSTPLPTLTPTITLTPTVTPTPFALGHRSIVIQQGVSGYLGTTDTYLSAWTPAGNFVYQANVVVKNDGNYSGLLRFDLGSMPPGSTIEQSILRLYPYYRSNAGSIDLSAYRVLRFWRDTEASWNRPTLDGSWGAPGASDTTTDRAGNPLATQAVSAINTWYQFDITSLVQEWASNPQTNQGVLLRGSGSASVSYHFASSNHTTISLRPQLWILYNAPETTATPTQAAPTATSTRTLTRTPTATTGVQPTATATPTTSPSAAPTLTATATRSPTPYASPTATQTQTATLEPTTSPTQAMQGRVEDLERRTTTLEQIIQAILDILKRAGRLGR